MIVGQVVPIQHGMLLCSVFNLGIRYGKFHTLLSLLFFLLLVHNVMDTVMGGASSITINYVSYRFLIEIKNLI